MEASEGDRARLQNSRLAPMIDRVVMIFERCLGSDHPRTIRAREWWQPIHQSR